MDIHGVSLLGAIPARAEASHKSELVTQVVFGELFTIVEETEGWNLIEITSDSYRGWIPKSNITPLSADEYQSILQSPKWIVADPLIRVMMVDTSETFYIPGGSEIHEFIESDYSFRLGKHWFQFIEKPRLTNPGETRNFSKTALRFIHSPYLWGGKTSMGMDCSGFSQTVFKICGTQIPRDASQQVALGNTINFITEAREGDLAFFDNEEGKIIHVGLLLSNTEIIHASGFVRIDTIDQTGIYNRTLKKYSHRLRIIKRL